MIQLALMMSAAGVADYYEDAEQWTRNHFAESQLTECDWIKKVSRKYKESPVGPHETAEGVPERCLGAFAGWSTASDWWIPGGFKGGGIMNCCTGNCSRAIYYIWRYILDYRDGQLQVNMLLNRASRWADVYSYIPYQGRVDLKIKTDCRRVLVHAPEWIASGSDRITATVDGQSRAYRWENRYVDLGEVKAGSKVEIQFPISQRTVKKKIGRVRYTLVIKGNTVVSIDPPGKNHPLYQRDAYRNDQVRWRKVQRFVSDEEDKLW